MTVFLAGAAALLLLCVPVIVAIRCRNRWKPLERPGSDAQFARWLNPQKADDRSPMDQSTLFDTEETR